jgi:hypothetical protein
MSYNKAIALGLLAVLGACSATPPQDLALKTTPQLVTTAVPANTLVAQNTRSSETKKPEIVAEIDQGLPIRKGMAYREARQLLIEQGWFPNPNVESNLRSLQVRKLYDLGYVEIEDCAGTGEAPCRFQFVNQKGEILFVVTAGRDALVKTWWIEQKSDLSQKNPASNSIQPGLYWVGPTDEGLEIQAERYRYYDESGVDKMWRPISELEYVKNGVVFFGENYWCLSTLVPKNRISTCSANGWVTAEILPFVGMRRFNFLGGSGTGRTITIESNGDTLVQLHGTMRTSVLYRGTFSNPIILEDGNKLLLEADKIYSLGADQNSAKDCKSTKENPCEAKLY